MKRRNFILSSGVALGGASAAFGLLQKPTVALEFTVDGYDISQKSIGNLENINEVKIDFDSFTVGTQYLDTSKKLSIKLDLTIKDKGGEIASSSEIYEFGGSASGTFTNAQDNDFSGKFSTPAISVSNVGDNIHLQYYKDNVYTGSSLSDSEIYESITLKGDITATITHDDLSSDKTYSQEIYLSDDGDSDTGSYGLYDVVTRYGDKSNLFNQYEKRILESTNSSAVFTVDTDGAGGDNVTHLDGLLSVHVASTSGFVTSSKKIEAIARDSENNRATRESYVNGSSLGATSNDTPYTYEAGDEDNNSYFSDTA